MEISEIQVDGYEKVLRCRDTDSGLHAIIAVHDTTLGPALGGMRMWPYVSEDEALFDVLRLSRGMTFKSAVAETGLGGGKSVIIGDPKTQKSEKLFLAMGRFVDSLDGKYITAEDMNIGIPDLDIVKRETRWVTGLSRESGQLGKPLAPTPRAAVCRACGPCSRSCTGRTRSTVAGSSCRASARSVAASPSSSRRRVPRSYICDINADRVRELSKEYGFEAVSRRRATSKSSATSTAPCARGAGINDETIPRLRCKRGRRLREQPAAGAAARGRSPKSSGILYAPDYVINAGGIINVSVELLPGGYDEAEALRRIDRIYDNLKLLFEISERENLSTRAASQRLAEQRIAEAKAG